MHLPIFDQPVYNSAEESDQLLVTKAESLSDSAYLAAKGPAEPDVKQAEVPALEVPAADNVPLFLQNEIDDLRYEAEQNRAEIATLREQISALTTASTQGSVLEPAGSSSSASQRPTRTPGVLNREALIQAGVASDLVDSIQQRQDQQSLARLELFDRAAREGWTNSERLTEELEGLDEASLSLREELGDEAYDQFLHNAGRANRVVVASIITGSTADISGLQIGDVIFSYASNRVFTQQELRDATREGVRDEPIVLEVLRDQRPFTLDAIRGPLGITMTAASVEP